MTFATRTVPIYLVHFRHYCQPCACMVCGWANPPCYGDDNHLSYTILTRQHGTLAERLTKARLQSQLILAEHVL